MPPNPLALKYYLYSDDFLRWELDSNILPLFKNFDLTQEKKSSITELSPLLALFLHQISLPLTHPITANDTICCPSQKSKYRNHT